MVGPFCNVTRYTRIGPRKSVRATVPGNVLSSAFPAGSSVSRSGRIVRVIGRPDSLWLPATDTVGPRSSRMRPGATLVPGRKFESPRNDAENAETG